MVTTRYSSGVINIFNKVELSGLSTDTKPTHIPEMTTVELPNGAEYIEIDTGKRYLFDKESSIWVVQKTSVAPSEDIDKDTVLLLHAEDFKDSSIYKMSVYDYGIPLHNDGKFGKSFGGRDQAAVSVSNNELFGIDRSRDLTIDFWAKEVFTSDTGYLAFGKTDRQDMLSWVFRYDFGKLGMWIWNNGNWAQTIQKEYTPTVGVWKHFAIVVKSGVLSIYINGILFTSATLTVDSLKSTYTPLFIGSEPRNPNYIYVDELRISKVARWDSNFTPPTEPYTK